MSQRGIAGYFRRIPDGDNAQAPRKMDTTEPQKPRSSAGAQDCGEADATATNTNGKFLSATPSQTAQGPARKRLRLSLSKSKQKWTSSSKTPLTMASTRRTASPTSPRAPAAPLSPLRFSESRSAGVPPPSPLRERGKKAVNVFRLQPPLGSGRASPRRSSPVPQPGLGSSRHLAAALSSVPTTIESTGDGAGAAVPAEDIPPLDDDLVLADIDFDEFFSDSSQASPKKMKTPSPPVAQTPPPQAPAPSVHEAPYRRLLVLDVADSTYPTTNLGEPPQKQQLVLRAIDEQGGALVVCHLRDEWARSVVKPGDYIHVTGGDTDPRTSQYVVDNDHCTLAIHPDTLISGTRISEALDCERKAVLSERFNSSSGKSVAMLLGTILHELFERALRARDFTDATLQKATDELLVEYLESIYAIDESEGSLRAQIHSFYPMISAWVAHFLDTSEDHSSSVDFNPGGPSSGPAMAASHRDVQVAEVADLEELVWSPRYGLKGKIDATLGVRIHPRGAKAEGKRAPLELKTGRLSSVGLVGHRAQVILYMLMLGDKYREAVDAGLLVYLKTGDTLGVGLDRADTRALMMVRNHLASFLAETSRMPAMLHSPRQCARCWHLRTCTLTHAALENGTAASSGMDSLFVQRTTHLTDDHLAYFREWYAMILLEHSQSGAQKEIWTMTGSDREKLTGRCLGALTLDSEADDRNQYRFSRWAASSTGENTGSTSHASQASQSRSLTAARISEGDTVIISEEDGRAVALATGKVSALTADQVIVACDTSLSTIDPPCTGSTVTPKLYRLDRDESAFGLKIAMTNLTSLFSSEADEDTLPPGAVPQLRRLRELIVDLRPPSFALDAENQLDLAEGGLGWDRLNECQRGAIHRTIAAQDYSLILGMPGTGKTTTITTLINVLVRAGKSVLVTSYTHNAVDNILLKLIQDGTPFLRIGNAKRVHAEITKYTAEHAKQTIKTVDDLSELYDSAQVVAATCLGLHHPLFQKRRFDVCIVDEASQITQPVCVGAVAAADKFVLVGDHYQLLPLVQSKEAQARGMDVSLFKRLCEAHPGAVSELDMQYRMNSAIVTLPNRLIYDDRLRCGTQLVADARIQLEPIAATANFASADWLDASLNPETPVAFLDTTAVPAPEIRHGYIIRNTVEATIVARICEGLLAHGVPQGDIGVISPYRAQLGAIRHALGDGCADIEVDTVDRYQGRDKQCIVLSLVRSNESSGAGGLLQDWRRVNVAITRAKTKLILVGCATALGQSHLFAEMLSIIDESNGIVNLPRGAHRT